MKKTLLFTLLLACSALSLSAQAIEIAPCSFEGESGAMAPRCAKQIIGGHSIEIAKLPPHQNVYVIKIDDQPAKRFTIEDRNNMVNYGWPLPFLANLETLVMTERGSLHFYKIPSVLQIEEGSVLPIKYENRLSSFFMVNESGEGLSTDRSEQFASFFDVDSQGIFLGKNDRSPKIYIEYQVDPKWVDAEYRKKALLDSAETHYFAAGSNCDSNYINRLRKKNCLKKAKASYDAAVLAIKEGKPQTYVVDQGIENTRMGPFYTSPAEGAKYSLAIMMKNIGTPDASLKNWFLMIRNPWEGRNARLDLERENPYLKLVQ